MNENDELIDTKRVANILNISYHTVKGYLYKRQLIPDRKIKGKPFFILRKILLFKRPKIGGKRNRHRGHTCIRQYDIDTKNGFKICKTCNKTKDIKHFKLSKKRGNLYSIHCYECECSNRKTRRSKRILILRSQNRKYRIKNCQNPQFHINERISANIRKSLKGNKNGRQWESLVGYTLQDFVKHLENNFTNEVSWENISEWHIHHVLPKRLFKYDSPEHIEFKICWSLNNLAPKMGKDNIRENDFLDNGKRARDLSEIERLEYLRSKGFNL